MKSAATLPQGWMGKRCRKVLRKIAGRVPRGGIVAEVGSWRGRSTLVLADHLPPHARLYAIDTWAGVPDDPEQHARLYENAGDVYADFCANLEGPIRSGRVTPLRMTSLEGARQLYAWHGRQALDFVFIDADHRYKAVHGDILAYRALVKPGGILAGHDYSPNWPGVMQAVGQLLPGFQVAKRSSLWYWRVPA